MVIVGELINASRKSIKPMLEGKDAAGIAGVAREEVERGAHYIDVNAGIFVDKEPEYLKWAVETVQAEVDAPCSIDSPSYEAIEAALSVHKGTPLINSISLEKERYDNVMPILTSSPDLRAIALCMDDDGMPETKDDRMRIADKLVTKLTQSGIKLDNIFVDPLVQPISTDDSYGLQFLNTVQAIHQAFPGIHTMCGLSNISYGIPERKFANRTFMAMAIAMGLDGAIMNPKDRQMMAAIVAAETLAGRDTYCENYLDAYRDGIFEPKKKAASQ